CTRVDAPRALAPERLAAHWTTAVGGGTVRVEADPGAALDVALAAGSGPLVVAGSLYLVGEVRKRLVRDRMFEDPA
ncbi:MAG TPA: hypothetical protein VM344_09235, partial [Vitreimonas sp.]|nr:hypothetical protein [Vitreimonas sp.]